MIAPALYATAELPAGMIFVALGRPLRIVRCYGADDGAPVVLEELAAVGDAAVGQYALWSADGVRRAMQVPI